MAISIVSRMRGTKKNRRLKVNPTSKENQFFFHHFGFGDSIWHSMQTMYIFVTRRIDLVFEGEPDEQKGSQKFRSREFRQLHPSAIRQENYCWEFFFNGN